MIYKGIVEKVTKNQVRVRIPRLNKSSFAVGATSVGQLSDACICTLPGIKVNLQVNDIVFVEFEDTVNEAPVIVGTLYGFKSTSKCDVSCTDLDVSVTARLPEDIEIGEIKYSHLKKLTGITVNIQNKFESVDRNTDNLSTKVKQLVEENKSLKKRLDKIEKLLGI